jgi:hypothetical protein
VSNDDKMFDDINTRLVADVKKKEEELRKLQVRPGNTKGGSITVPLTSCLTGTNLNGTIKNTAVLGYTRHKTLHS